MEGGAPPKYVLIPLKKNHDVTKCIIPLSHQLYDIVPADDDDDHKPSTRRPRASSKKSPNTSSTPPPPPRPDDDDTPPPPSTSCTAPTPRHSVSRRPCAGTPWKSATDVCTILNIWNPADLAAYPSAVNGVTPYAVKPNTDYGRVPARSPPVLRHRRPSCTACIRRGTVTHVMRNLATPRPVRDLFPAPYQCPSPS